jgi:hypothetical protein
MYEVCVCVYIYIYIHTGFGIVTGMDDGKVHSKLMYEGCVCVCVCVCMYT